MTGDTVNSGPEPDPGFDEHSPPPVNGPEDYGADAISMNEPWTVPGDVDWIYGHAEEAGEPNGQAEPRNTGYERLCLTLDEWAERNVPPPDFLLGSIFSTTTRVMLSAETGLGKTHLGFAFAFAMATGEGFCHWDARRRARVLIVDGEMPVDLVKQRLADAARRIGQNPETLFMLCKEDVETMLPLDTEEGQRWLDGLIGHLGGVDFLILDNAMSLTIGDLKEEEAWKPITPWMQSLTKRRTGVLWINHTGHDKTRSYGTSTREWQLDTVMIAVKVDDPDADIAMKLSFTKARQRKPETREDFETVVLRLQDDVWSSECAAPERKRRQVDDALDFLRRAVDEAGEQIPGEGANVRGVRVELWERYCEGLTRSDNPSSRDKAFNRARKKLLDKKIIRAKRGKVWIIQ